MKDVLENLADLEKMYRLLVLELVTVSGIMLARGRGSRGVKYCLGMQVTNKKRMRDEYL